MGIVFVNKQNFWEQIKFCDKEGILKITNDWKRNWIAQRHEKIESWKSCKQSEWMSNFPKDFEKLFLNEHYFD